MVTSLIRESRRGAVAVLILDDGSGRNVLSLEMRAQLHSSLELLLGDSACRAIVLTGAGNFCFGGDLRQMDVKTREEAYARLELVHNIIRYVAAGPKPVVTAVAGVAAGGGTSLVAGSDHAVASRTARFAASFMRTGVLPDMGAIATVGRRMGAARARKFFCLGQSMSADDALAAGLVDQVVEPDELLDTAVAVAEQMASLPPLTFAAFKLAFADHGAGLSQTLDAEMRLQPALLTSRDHREAVAAFLERRVPVFGGH